MTNKQKTERQGITARDAALAAVAYLHDVAGMVVTPSVEEIELDAKREYWFVTLGYFEGGQSPFGGNKVYKLFKVDAHTGEVVVMKIREIKV